MESLAEAFEGRLSGYERKKLTRFIPLMYLNIQ